MIQFLLNILYSLQIKMLMVFRPSALFHKINQLDWYKATLHKWVSQYSFSKHAIILDAGCATGSLTKYLEQAQLAPIGVDFSKSMINEARKKYPSIHFQTADVTKLSFSDETFDAVVSSSLLNIISEQQSMVNEMVRVCKRGGTISVLVPADNFNRESFHELEEELAISNFSKAALTAWYQYPIKMSSHDVEKLFQSAGLKTSPPVHYLNGMVFSISAIKIEHNPDTRSDP